MADAEDGVMAPPYGDADDLAAMGHEEGLTRKFDTISMLALAFCVLGTWSTFAQDLAQGLANGGPVDMLWGLCLVTLCNLAVVLSLGEMLSAMPTTMGQAYWTFRLGGQTPGARFASYCCAWINTFGWWTLTASQIAFVNQFILGIKEIWDPGWPGAYQDWTQFVIFIGTTALFTFLNTIACRNDSILPWFNNFVGIWFMCLFVGISMALLIATGTKPGLSFQPASFVFGTFLNATGWNNGVTWFIGLLQAAYGLTAFDSVIHMVEEMPSPRRDAPRVMFMSVAFGALTGFIFLIVCLFCIQDLDNILLALIPFMNLLQECIGLQGATALLVLFTPFGLGGTISTMTTSSRLTWAFARDGGLPFSKGLAYVSPKWKAPIRALWLQGAVIMLVGVLYFASDEVLVAVLSVSTIALTVSYGIPIAVLLIVGRDKLPPGGYSLGRWGPLMNWVGVIYCVITTVFFFFPSSPDPQVDDMNYAIAIFAVMLLCAGGFWIFKGRKTYLRNDDAARRMREARQMENKSG
ncbi:hypothetical protein ANO11243_049330 [Dothideomycetidae sp. 11243]|nr:hypothetical protein ANO11243_049330 [fungal sp. No.11243]